MRMLKTTVLSLLFGTALVASQGSLRAQPSPGGCDFSCEICDADGANDSSDADFGDGRRPSGHRSPVRTAACGVCRNCISHGAAAPVSGDPRAQDPCGRCDEALGACVASHQTTCSADWFACMSACSGLHPTL